MKTNTVNADTANTDTVSRNTLNTDKLNVLILGATGSVGSQALEIIGNHPDVDDISVVMNANIKALEKVIILNKNIGKIGIFDEKAASDIKDSRILQQKKLFTGKKGILDLIQQKHDICIAAIPGILFIDILIEAIRNSKIIAIASKEVIMCTWHIIKKVAEESNTQVIPIDSEQNAIFKLLSDLKNCKTTITGIAVPSNIESITITASGGPLWDLTNQEIKNATLETVLKHPNWKMGPKNSVDSATMFNKVLEIGGSAHLFNAPIDMFRVLIHRESLVHAILHDNSGNMKMHIAPVDMKVPIIHGLQHAGLKVGYNKRISLPDIGKLSFFERNDDKFPLLKIGIDLFKDTEKEKKIIILNAANEFAVECFMEQKISFGEIVDIVSKALDLEIMGNFDLNSSEAVIDLHYETIKKVQEKQK